MIEVQEALAEAKAGGIDAAARARARRGAGAAAGARARRRRRPSSAGAPDWDAALDAGADRAAAPRVVQGAARHAGVSAHRHRRSRRRARRGRRACRASSALTSAPPTAWWPTSTAALPRVIPDAEGARCCPRSWRSRPAGVLVGEAARRQLVRQPARTVYSVKRLMGRGYEDVKDELAPLPVRGRSRAPRCRAHPGRRPRGDAARGVGASSSGRSSSAPRRTSASPSSRR